MPLSIFLQSEIFETQIRNVASFSTNEFRKLPIKSLTVPLGNLVNLNHKTASKQVRETYVGNIFAILKIVPRRS